MNKLFGKLALLAGSLLLSSQACAEQISAAHYATPVNRYGHFALGRPHEYAAVAVRTDAGREIQLTLPESEVFEDLAPRIVQLAPDAPKEILAIVSHRESGSRLVLIGLQNGELEISAKSAPTGRPNRWLNPVGVADLDGDGRAEIAAVITPHIGGTLKVYRKEGNALIEIAALGGFSNHVYGTSELGLSAPLSIGGKMHLLVPDTTRRQIRIISMEGGQLVETGRCSLPKALTEAVMVQFNPEKCHWK